MKIGLVLPAVPGYSETFFRSKIKGLQKAGFDVLLFVKNPKGRKDFTCPVEVHPKLKDNLLLRLLQSVIIFGKMMVHAPKATARLIKIERGQGKSAVQAIQSVVVASSILPHQLDWLHFGFATTALQRENIAQAIGAKLAVSFRGYDISVVPIKEPNCYDSLWKKIDKVHTISDDLVNLAYSFGLPKTVAVKKITPAIQVEKFTQNTNSLSSKTFLSVGRLHWKKGFPYVLKALSLIKSKGVEFEYNIVGNGEEFERLKFAVEQLELTKHVHFLGKKPHHEIPQFMSSADVYIQFSNQEGFCNAVLEAQASGMLCIVSDAEGLQENVLHNQTGWVVPKRQPERLAEKLMEVLALADEEKAAIQKTARQRIEREFTIEKQQREFVEFYQN